MTMMPLANPLRGEASVKIGSEKFRIAVTFGGLVRLSEALGARTIEELYIRLLGFEPKAVACAIRCLAVADTDAEASRIAATVLREENISTADEVAWRTAIETALSSHASAGRARRDDRVAFDVASASLPGNVQSPS